jgi:hypothetical protein
MYPTDKEEERGEKSVVVGERGEGSFEVCTTLFMWSPKMVLLVVGGDVEMASRAANDWMLQKTTASTCWPVEARQMPS